ncbi:MAG TPA: HEAT repeat domain-containing protein [Verrucomicrobiae bacterium]|nr:HEAT repeat domain-containing protein [Verrucomicrobiae bacterium]
MHRCLPWLVAFGISAHAQAATNLWLDDQFELPPGFRIYRAAGPELSGGSYALTVDGEGRLLVGDGTAVRRLTDRDGDGVFDRFEVIATGLGVRGPQGLLVYGDDLYAVGGDGLQHFSGYRSGGLLQHRGRLGNRLRTGGDHDAHSLLRGHDGWIHLMAGNGSGLTNRQHITEASSPALFEREASIFRISRDGTRWECLASGGRNPPNLGLNETGDWFSFDSDMEWHVGLPWYRPVRLNHWVLGGDQGWQEVGAYPPYFIDNLPGILEVGRGSPDWGVFYEHTQLPESYRDAFLVCDYRWKRESDDRYATTGRLVAFFLHRQGSSWAATMQTLARPRPGARDPQGRPIQFALVDIAVAADGSLLLSDHNQGIWRICYAPNTAADAAPPPAITPWPEPNPSSVLSTLLTLPQPGAERTRLREEELIHRLGPTAAGVLQRSALDSRRPLPERLRAVRLLSPQFAELPAGFIQALSKQRTVELRAQAATLLGWRGGEESVLQLLGLLNDQDPFVRRRAAEALVRLASPSATGKLIARLEDPDRLVRYVVMLALAHRPTAEWFDLVVRRGSPQPRMRALTAAYLRQEPASPEQTRQVVRALLPVIPAASDAAKANASSPVNRQGAGETQPLGVSPAISHEDQLDLLRVLGLFRQAISADAALRDAVHRFLQHDFVDGDRQIRWEQTRLLGVYGVEQGFPILLRALEQERDPVTQFHLAESLADLRAGWTPDEERRALDWFLGTQHGWFNEFSGKGVQFPEFWATVLTEFSAHHGPALLQQSARLDWTGLLGGVALEAMAARSPDGAELIQLYTTQSAAPVRLRILQALRPARSEKLTRLLQSEHDRIDGTTRAGSDLHGAILQYWAAHPDEVNRPFLIYEGLLHEDAQVVRAAAHTLCADAPALRRTLDRNLTASSKPASHTPADLATDLIRRMQERPDLFAALEQVLANWSEKPRAGYQPSAELKHRVEDLTRTAALEHWRAWYQNRFGTPFSTKSPAAASPKTDAEIHQFLLGDAGRGGDATRGAKIYETLQCQTCHGGGVAPGREGRLFGPDLAGVTRRLTRMELADSLVYPSKQIADRFKGSEVTLKDGGSVTGFITEQTADSITIAEHEQVRRLPRSSIQNVAPLSTSLMPDSLLNRLSWEELRDLISFLESR